MAKGLKYSLTDIDEYTFEALCTLICKDLFGIGVNSFSSGKDGGRDAKFTGTATKYPSEKSQWNGITIVQAKHTTKLNASCSDKEFNKILSAEKTKIQKLIENKQIDYYLILTNRKLTAIQEANIDNDFKSIGLKGFAIHGIEYIDSLLVSNQKIVETLHLDPITYPFRLNSSDFQNIIIEFSNNPTFKQTDSVVKDKNYDIQYPGIEQKNTLNNLSVSDFNNLIKNKSYQYFGDIDKFLREPANEKYLEIYNNISSEIHCKLHILKRYESNFATILVEIYDQIISNVPELSQKSRLIWIFLHYMYCNCDFGDK